MVKGKIGKQIGYGSFGYIYEIHMPDGEKKAVKIIEDTDDGPPDLVEVSIMATYNHPSLNRCSNVKKFKSRIYLIQDLATNDLSKYTKDKCVKGALLRSWSNSICQAVNCLHKESIIHCDIKASNVLRYHDNTVRLTDFTLAVLAPSKSSTYSHDICTITHRPPECLLKKKWGFSADIWSLGCTLYQIATGKLLFPYQGKDIDEALEKKEIKKVDAINRANERTLKCIRYWLSRNGSEDLGEYYMKEVEEKDFIPAKFHDNWIKQDQAFRDLVMSMLSWDPEKRPTIEQILVSEYFHGIEEWGYLKKVTNSQPLTNLEIRLIEQHANTHFLSEYATTKLKELYSRCLYLNKFKKKTIPTGLPLVMGCMLIASKMIEGGVPFTKYPKNQLLEMEGMICEHLGYRLHLSTKCETIILLDDD